jgi:hypothetical protein
MLSRLENEEDEKEVRKEQVHPDREQRLHNRMIRASEIPDAPIQAEGLGNHSVTYSNISESASDNANSL